MNRETFEEKALLYALGTLPPSEVEAFEAAVRNDRELQTLVHESQRLNELQAAECEPCVPPFQAYPSIMTRIDAEMGPQLAPAGLGRESDARESRGKLTPFLSWSGWGLAACAALVLGLQFLGGGIAGNATSPNADIVVNNLANPRLVAVHPPSETFGLEDRMLELAGLAEAYWFARDGVPTSQLLADSGAEIDELSGGFTIFDRKYQIGFIGVENMPREPEGKSYHVWARTENGSKVVRAGALPIGDESRGLFFFDLSALAGQVDSLDRVTFFVTEESSEDPQRPNRDMIVLSDF